MILTISINHSREELRIDEIKLIVASGRSAL